MAHLPIGSHVQSFCSFFIFLFTFQIYEKFCDNLETVISKVLLFINSITRLWNTIYAPFCLRIGGIFDHMILYCSYNTWRVEQTLFLSRCYLGFSGTCPWFDAYNLWWFGKLKRGRELWFLVCIVIIMAPMTGKEWMNLWKRQGRWSSGI